MQQYRLCHLWVRISRSHVQPLKSIQCQIVVWTLFRIHSCKIMVVPSFSTAVLPCQPPCFVRGPWHAWVWEVRPNDSEGWWNIFMRFCGAKLKVIALLWALSHPIPSEATLLLLLAQGSSDLNWPWLKPRILERHKSPIGPRASVFFDTENAWVMCSHMAYNPK